MGGGGCEIPKALGKKTRWISRRSRGSIRLGGGGRLWGRRRDSRIEVSGTTPLSSQTRAGKRRARRGAIKHDRRYSNRRSGTRGMVKKEMLMV